MVNYSLNSHKLCYIMLLVHGAALSFLLFLAFYSEAASFGENIVVREIWSRLFVFLLANSFFMILFSSA